MSEQNSKNGSLPKYDTAKYDTEGIASIEVGGFKSISQGQYIEIRPLTILAGANSSGKSSMMQPLLLLKQTLEAPYDPGALLLNGPNVRFTLVDQLLSRFSDGEAEDTFFIAIDTTETGVSLVTFFTRNKSVGRGFDVKETIYNTPKGMISLHRDMSQDEIQAIASILLGNRVGIIRESGQPDSEISLVRNRCFLTPTRNYRAGFTAPLLIYSGEIVGEYIRQVIHLPGLRGSPERDYPVTAVGPMFPGTFEIYAASIIEQWQLDDKKQQLARLSNDLARLALTNKIVARRKNDTAIELLVNRFTQGDKEDMVSIADVGLGVSQALPVIVALHTAEPGQLVYIEQPEIHLHPRAQFTMAEVLADAAKEGKRLVVETHSSLLLRGIQTAVAEGKLPPELVKLHWFTQQEDGSTRIDSADLDETGAFGNWPEDFHTVTLQSESRYIDAAEARLMGE